MPKEAVAASEARTIPRKPVAVNMPPADPTAPHISAEHARDMQRLLAAATSADECRLIVDMFLAKSGIVSQPSNIKAAAYPSPTPSLIRAQPNASSTPERLQHTLIELFLGAIPPPADNAPADAPANTDEPAPSKSLAVPASSS